MKGKTISESRMEMRYVAMPMDANPFGVMHGGRIAYYIDTATGTTAARHAGMRVVTVSIERLDYKEPVQIGETLVIKTAVNMAHNSSLEVGARIEAENPRTGVAHHVGTAYFSFVALNEQGKPTQVPIIIPENAEDERRMADAVRRRNLRRLERMQADGKAPKLCMELLPQHFSLFSLPPGSPMPALPETQFAMIARCSNELSLVLPTDSPLAAELASARTGRLDEGWRSLMLQGELDLSFTGILAALTGTLAAEGISVFAVATFNTNYLLIRETQITKAITALALAGHRFDCTLDDVEAAHETLLREL